MSPLEILCPKDWAARLAAFANASLDIVPAGLSAEWISSSCFFNQFFKCSAKNPGKLNFKPLLSESVLLGVTLAMKWVKSDLPKPTTSFRASSAISSSSLAPFHRPLKKSPIAPFAWGIGICIIVANLCERSPSRTSSPFCRGKSILRLAGNMKVSPVEARWTISW